MNLKKRIDQLNQAKDALLKAYKIIEADMETYDDDGCLLVKCLVKTSTQELDGFSLRLRLDE